MPQLTHSAMAGQMSGFQFPTTTYRTATSASCMHLESIKTFKSIRKNKQHNKTLDKMIEQTFPIRGKDL